MKKLLSLFLSITLIFSLAPTMAFAADNEAIYSADVLNALGLFDGTGTDENGNPIYGLEQASTRQEAVTMLVRLLGKSEEALSRNWTMPFTDVVAWAKPYVGYAYANGLVSGTTKTTFGGNDKVTAAHYITFVLRALGYESGKDFTWNKAWEFSDELLLTDGKYNENTKAFLRGDIAIISVSALKTPLKDSTETLFENMKKNGQFESDASLEVSRKSLGYNYFDSYSSNINYKEDYIRSASATKIGDRYQFEFILLPGHFQRAGLFPAGYMALNNIDNHPDGYSIDISITPSEKGDIARFSVDKEYLFHNPIETTEMIFVLYAIPEAFADDSETLKKITTTYGDISEYRIDTSFRTSHLPQ